MVASFGLVFSRNIEGLGFLMIFSNIIIFIGFLIKLWKPNYYNPNTSYYSFLPYLGNFASLTTTLFRSSNGKISEVIILSISLSILLKLLYNSLHFRLSLNTFFSDSQTLADHIFIINFFEVLQKIFDIDTKNSPPEEIEIALKHMRK